MALISARIPPKQRSGRSRPGLDEERSRLYYDLILASVSNKVRQELLSMDPAKYEYQSEFAKRYIALGEQEGMLHRRASDAYRTVFG